jgi:hypothetical protein
LSVKTKLHFPGGISVAARAAVANAQAMATAAIAPAIAPIHLRPSAFICGTFAFRLEQLQL